MPPASGAWGWEAPVQNPRPPTPPAPPRHRRKTSDCSDPRFRTQRRPRGNQQTEARSGRQSRVLLPALVLTVSLLPHILPCLSTCRAPPTTLPSPESGRSHSSRPCVHLSASCTQVRDPPCLSYKPLDTSSSRTPPRGQAATASPPPRDLCSRMCCPCHTEAFGRGGGGQHPSVPDSQQGAQ